MYAVFVIKNAVVNKKTWADCGLFLCYGECDVTADDVEFLLMMMSLWWEERGGHDEY